MSDTIRTRYQRNMPAALLQQRPSTLINEVEGRERTNVYCQPIYVDKRESINSLYTISTAPIGGFITGSTGVVGVGSAALDGWTQWAAITKKLLQQQEPKSKLIAKAAAKVRINRLTQIQTAFGLPTLVLAEILGITRQGLYKWLDATKEITLQESSRQRLAVVERLAKLWTERSNRPLSSVVYEPLNGEQTLIQILTESTLDETKIANIFNGLVEKLQDKPKSLSQRMADAGFSRRPSARALLAREDE